MTDRALALLAVASVVAVVVLGWRAVDFPVRTLVIAGDLSAGERETVAEALEPRVTGTLLRVDLEDVQEGLDAVDWARGVSVRRVWPDRLVVTVGKLQPVARWGRGQYLSADGNLLTLPDAVPGLPRFDVRLSSPRSAMEVYRLLDQIASREALRVVALSEDAQGEWQAELSDGTLAMLGAEALNERMHRLLHAYRWLLAGTERRAEYIDARYPSGVAVRFAAAPELTASVNAPTPSTDGPD